MRAVFFAVMIGATLLSACDSSSGNLDAPRTFFEKNKIGSSPDFAVIKWNDPEDHVITIHGFMDDMKSCLIVAEAMNADACKETGGRDCLRRRVTIS